jgi:hypothetical protein
MATTGRIDAGPGLVGPRWWLGFGLALALALLATVPTTGDIGLTWDEPSYRTSQLVSAQWWQALGKVRTRADLEALLDPETLLHDWPYARFGYNFHPPLAGQLNLLSHALLGGWMKDIPARRMASVIEYAFTIALLFGFLARRYGPWPGAVAAGSLLLMPRLYGDGHIAGTDTPGLLLWVATAFAFWKGLREPNARGWRVLVGILLGLGFVEKMAAVAILGPLLLWMVAGRLPKTFRQPGGRGDWVDGVITSTAMLVPIALALREVLRLARVFPEPNYVDLYTMHPSTSLPGAILAVPFLVWLVRRVAGWVLPRHPVWGVERPALETWTAILAFAPLVGWLGNPAWWRETLPRLAHYYQITADRRGALPDIRIAYFGQIYTYSLPWHNGWVWVGITVPAAILAASLVGLLVKLVRSGRDRDAIPWYFALHLVYLPLVRMLPTPAHDGVRLFLPTFAFLAAFAGWGTVAIADGVARGLGRRTLCRGVMAAVVLAPAGWQLARIHPYELSYYNELIGGPRGAWKAGFELSYWYEAFDGATLEEINHVLPDGSSVDFFNELVNTPTFQCLQELGRLKPTITLGAPDPEHFPHGWILTHDSKATPFTRLLFAMTPLYESRPRQLDGLRVVTVDTPEAVSRAWGLDVLTRAPSKSVIMHAPEWVMRSAWLRPFARFWGEGVTLGPALDSDETIFTWARVDPSGLREAAKILAIGAPIEPGSKAARLRSFLDRTLSDDPQDQRKWRGWVEALLRARPEGLAEAVEILIAHPDDVRAVLTRSRYTDPAEIGGPLDRDLTALMNMSRGRGLGR